MAHILGFIFWLAAIASFFTCIASIIHFQILAAMGFFILAFILFAIGNGFVEGA